MEKINMRIGNKVWGRTGGYNNDADKMDGVLFGNYIFHLTLFPLFLYFNNNNPDTFSVIFFN